MASTSNTPAEGDPTSPGAFERNLDAGFKERVDLRSLAKKPKRGPESLQNNPAVATPARFKMRRAGSVTRRKMSVASLLDCQADADADFDANVSSRSNENIITVRTAFATFDPIGIFSALFALTGWKWRSTVCLALIINLTAVVSVLAALLRARDGRTSEGAAVSIPFIVVSTSFMLLVAANHFWFGWSWASTLDYDIEDEFYQTSTIGKLFT